MRTFLIFVLGPLISKELSKVSSPLLVESLNYNVQVLKY